MRRHLRLVLPLMLALPLSGCLGFLIDTTADAAIAVAKVPFKVAGAVVDVATGGDDSSDKKSEKQSGKDSGQKSDDDKSDGKKKDD